MEPAAVQLTRHWAIADYFQRTFEDLLILRRVFLRRGAFVTFVIYLRRL